jgi:hypothetical protein
MPLSVGDKLGPYEILARNGEVHKARDTRLKCDVAIKDYGVCLVHVGFPIGGGS